MPPATWNENSFSRSLNELDDAKLFSALRLDDLRQYFSVVVNCLIRVFGAPKSFTLNNKFGNMLRKQHPPLMALQGCVPSRGIKRINVHSCPRALGTH